MRGSRWTRRRGLRARGRVVALTGNERRTARDEAIRAATSATDGCVLTDRLRPRSGGIYGGSPRIRPHPPLDGRDQLRPGRDGDLLHVHRLDPDDEPRLPYWPAFAGTLLVSFVGGVASTAVIRPVEQGRIASSSSRSACCCAQRPRFWIWGGERAPCRARSGRHDHIGGVAIAGRTSARSRCASVVLVLSALFQFTKVGLALRRGGESGGSAARRRARPLDARSRLGSRGDARRDRRAC